MKRRSDIPLHAILLVFVFLTMLPFLFVINNSLRTNTEMYHSFFGLPKSLENMARFTWYHLTGQAERIRLRRPMPEGKTAGQVRAADMPIEQAPYGRAMARLWDDLTRGYRYAWEVLRPYMVNTLLVCLTTAAAVVLVASISGYVFARYRFPGSKVLFVAVLSLMMIPGVLTLVPSFLLVKQLGLLNSYGVLILPYTAGGQIFAIFLFKGIMGTSQVAQNYSTMFAAYLLSSIPLLLLFIYATRPFLRGVASGAFKA